MKKIGTFLITIIFTLVLCSCEKKEVKNEYETYQVKSNSIAFSGYVDSKRYKSYMLTDQSIISVNNGDIVEEGQELYKINNSNSIETVKNNNRLKNIKQDIELCNNKISALKKKRTEVEKTMTSCSDPLLKEEYKGEKDNIDSSIGELESSRTELQRNLDDINIDIKYENQNETATFKGQVIIGDNVLELYSQDYEIVYNALQQQVNLFEKGKEYKVEMNGEEIGTALLKYVIPNDELTNKGTNSYYKVVFDINTDKSLMRNNVVNIIDKSNEILIPKDYVREDGEEYFMKINGSEVQVQLQKEESSYKVISGVNEGDVLESYRVKE